MQREEVGRPKVLMGLSFLFMFLVVLGHSFEK